MAGCTYLFQIYRHDCNRCGRIDTVTVAQNMEIVRVYSVYANRTDIVSHKAPWSLEIVSLKRVSTCLIDIRLDI